jgi:hypothetical protein
LTAIYSSLSSLDASSSDISQSGAPRLFFSSLFTACTVGISYCLCCALTVALISKLSLNRETSVGNDIAYSPNLKLDFMSPLPTVADFMYASIDSTRSFKFDLFNISAVVVSVLSAIHLDLNKPCTCPMWRILDKTDIFTSDCLSCFLFSLLYRKLPIARRAESVL